MALEMIGSRVVAPLVGASIISWSALIGMSLFGITLGAYFGGRLADKYNTYTLVVVCCSISGASLSSVPFLAHLVSLWAIPFSLGIESVVLALILIFPSAVLLGAAFPVFATGATRNEGQPGSIYGLLSGASSLGSILGVFLTGFFFISYFGTKNILFVLAFVMLSFAVFFSISSNMVVSGRVKQVLGVSALIILLFFLWSIFSAPKPETLLYSGDSRYYHIRVMDLEAEGFGSVRTLILDADTHSYATKKVWKELYSNITPVLGMIAPQKENVLFVGAGAYTMPLLFSHENPKSRVTVSEIDPALQNIGERFFDLDRSRIKTVVGDGRTFLSQTDQKYDIIFGDAYSSFISVPWHLLTREYYETVKRRLAPGGVYGMSFVSTRGESGKQMTGSVAGTFREAFPNYVAFAFGKKDDSPQNIVLLGRMDDKIIDIEKLKKDISSDKNFNYLVDNIISLPVEPEALILTDNYAPVEKIMKPIITSYLPFYRRAYGSFLSEGL